ncbi:hypothetical protein POTOM_028293 [Populus tomentosa]|uniref:Uncharacterized protein n=1 Tax=Populus tomentosa TaxID=118781 RepID=A0A8X7ZC24_POPTO|nr:hypothetical protein POTOM_028293 [Populus tomentosa]
MATLANSNTITITAADHSPRHTIAADSISNSNQVGSPQSQRGSGKQVSPPWTRIVRGVESESSSNASTEAEQAAAVFGTETASSSSQKQVNNTANPNSTPNNAVPARQKSMKHNGVNTASNGGTHSPGSQSAAGEGHLNNSSSRDNAQKSSQSRGSNDHPQQQRTSFRNRNGGLHSRGDGSHHHSYGGRRNDLDPANHDWNAHRNFSRDGHMQPLPRVAPRHMRHPSPPPPTPATSPFIAPPPVRPFGLVGFPDMGLPLYYVSPHPGSVRGVPIIAAPVPSHTVFFPSDPQLHIRILHQIDYYFRTMKFIGKLTTIAPHKCLLQ